jgi:hypothetical protein
MLIIFRFVTKSVMKGEKKVQQGNWTGYQVTNYMVSSLHVVAR